MQVCGLLLCCLLFAGGFLSTCYSTDMDSQLVLTRLDNPFFNLLGMGIFFFVLFCLVRLFAGKRIRLLTVLTLLWCLFAGALLIVFGRTAPAADSQSVYSIAEALAAGDLSVIDPTQSYLSYYPQQIGLAAFFSLLMRCLRLLGIHMPAYHFIKCIFVLSACVIVFLQQKIVHLIWENETADCIYLVLAGANLPFLMYTSFIYGEIPSFTAMTAGLFLLTVLWKRPPRRTPAKICAAVGALLFLACSVFLRKNNLIPVIAVLIVCFFQCLAQKRLSLLLWGIACGVCCFFVLPATQSCYERSAGSTLSSGVTATSYFAMGMQEASRANGWYNGFNFNTYRDTGMDTEKTNELSREAIDERLSYFSRNPGYAARFYLQKHLSQWADGSYASRQATLATYGGRSAFFESLYSGSASGFYIEYCNVYQNMLYLGALLFALSALRRREDSLPLYLGMIAVLGGFLFHILWEANARYIFLYSLLLMPYAAYGLSLAHKWAAQRLAAHNFSFTAARRHAKMKPAETKKQ